MKKQIFLTSSLLSQMIHPSLGHAAVAGDNLKDRLNEFLLADAQRAEPGSETFAYRVNGKLEGTVQIKQLRVPFRHLMASSSCTTRCDVDPTPPPSCTTRCEVSPAPTPAPAPAPTPPPTCTTRCDDTPGPVPAPVEKKPSENFIKTYGYQIILGSVAGVPQPEGKPPYYFARKIRETADATIFEVFQFDEMSDSAQPKGAAYLEVNRKTGELRFSSWTHWN